MFARIFNLHELQTSCCNLVLEQFYSKLQHHAAPQQHSPLHTRSLLEFSNPWPCQRLLVTIPLAQLPCPTNSAKYLRSKLPWILLLHHQLVAQAWSHSFPPCQSASIQISESPRSSPIHEAIYALLFKQIVSQLFHGLNVQKHKSQDQQHQHTSTVNNINNNTNDDHHHNRHLNHPINGRMHSTRKRFWDLANIDDIAAAYQVLCRPQQPRPVTTVCWTVDTSCTQNHLRDVAHEPSEVGILVFVECQLRPALNKAVSPNDRISSISCPVLPVCLLLCNSILTLGVVGPRVQTVSLCFWRWCC